MRTIIITTITVFTMFLCSAVVNGQGNDKPHIDFGMKPVKLEIPPFKGQFANVKQKAEMIALKKVTQQKNQIIDEENWFSSNALTFPSYTPDNPFMGQSGEIPPEIPVKYGDRILTDCFYDNNYIYMIYGKDFADREILFVCDKAKSSMKYAFDFSNYIYSPDYIAADKEFIYQSVNWATIEGGILYVSNAHSTYASSSRNMNAYITAIDLKTNSILWRSQPLICNSRNFLVEGDVIITGYGFTQEKDFIYLLDKYSGRVIGKTKIASAAEMFIKKDGKLFVRTYNTDYVFEINKG